MNETGQSHFHVKQKIISKKYLVLFYALFKVLRKCILQPSNNAKMKNSIWRNVVDPLYNFTMNIEKKLQKWKRVSEAIIELFRKINPSLASDKSRKVL